MSIDPSFELAQFQQFIAKHVEQGIALSPEEALDLWRLENPQPHVLAEDVEAVREALADVDAGNFGVPLEEFEREFRRRHGLASNE